MNKLNLKNIFTASKPVIKKFMQRFNKCSIHLAINENKFGDLIKKLRKIQPDISRQYSSQQGFNQYWELKMRALHAFQCYLMCEGLRSLPPRKSTVVDIGDSAGTHMLYLKELTKDRLDIDTLSVNLDPRAIQRIRARGLKAILCRAEELSLENKQISLFTSFEMVEHLHNPAIFFRRLAKKSQCNRLIITVPYMKKSRLGLYHVRKSSDEIVYAGGEHIFELNPEDWTLLMLHSGWKVIYGKIYYQYPRKWPVINQILALYWRMTDFEGFWGAILEKDTTYSDYYQDWED